MRLLNNNMAYNSQDTGNRKGLPQRRSIRLKGYDYSQAGLYFITICCQDRTCRLGEVVGAGFTPAQKGQPGQIGQPQGIAHTTQMVLNEYGNIAYNEWAKLPERFTNFELDIFQIMPNHMHGIIVLKDVVGATLAVARDDDDDDDAVARDDDDAVARDDDDVVARDNTVGDGDIGAGASPAPTSATISDIVGAYKSLVANGCLEIYKSKNEMMGKLWQRNYYEHIIRNEQSYNTISDYIINNPAKWAEDKFYRQ